MQDFASPLCVGAAVPLYVIVPAGGAVIPDELIATAGPETQ